MSPLLPLYQEDGRLVRPTFFLFFLCFLFFLFEFVLIPENQSMWTETQVRSQSPGSFKVPGLDLCWLLDANMKASLDNLRI